MLEVCTKAHINMNCVITIEKCRFIGVFHGLSRTCPNPLLGPHISN